MEDSIWLLWVVMDSRGRRSQPQIPYVKENAPYVKTFRVYHHESFDPNMDLTVLPLWVQSALPWINEPFLMAKKKKLEGVAVVQTHQGKNVPLLENKQLLSSTRCSVMSVFTKKTCILVKSVSISEETTESQKGFHSGCCLLSAFHLPKEYLSGSPG